jgi:F-type H+-transporting ATPase subunit b
MGAEFWVAVSLVIFLALAVWQGKDAILATLDKRTADIRAQIEEAARLRDEAQASLAEYRRKQRDAVQEAEAIVRHAQEEARRRTSEAEGELVRSLARRRDQALQKITQAEADAVREVRNIAVDLAVAATRRVLATALAGEPGHRLVNQAIAEIPDKLH